LRVVVAVVQFLLVAVVLAALELALVYQYLLVLITQSPLVAVETVLLQEHQEVLTVMTLLLQVLLLQKVLLALELTP
jgi:hypothetical protein